MNYKAGLDAEITLEELISMLPGKKKDIYEDDAEDLLDLIAEKGAMTPAAAWKMLDVTAVSEDTVTLNGVEIRGKGLADKLNAGDKICCAISTCGADLHQMLEEEDDIMVQYVLGFLMSHILTIETAQVIRALAEETGLAHVEMLMAGIEAICPMDQQEKIARIMPEEFAALKVTVNPGGSLSPAYSSTAFYLMSDGEKNLPSDWDDVEERNTFTQKLYTLAGHC